MPEDRVTRSFEEVPVTTARPFAMAHDRTLAAAPISMRGTASYTLRIARDIQASAADSEPVPVRPTAYANMPERTSPRSSLPAGFESAAPNGIAALIEL